MTIARKYRGIPSNLGLMLANEAYRTSAEKRIVNRLTRKPSGCWEWTGCLSRGGYGVIGIGGICFLTHRVSFSIFRTSIPEGLDLLHRCDNPPCCNPYHLFVGTRADNCRDMYEKKRDAISRGTHRGFDVKRGEQVETAKLTSSQVLEIRRLKTLGVSSKALAKQFGVDPSTISLAYRGKRWRHVA
jgi:hypothetical protein